MSSNTGNINYSLNKNNVYKVLVGCVSYFMPHYFVLIIISILYIFRIRYQQYYFDDRDKGKEEDKDVLHFFGSITNGSPFNILTISKAFKDIEEKNNIKGNEIRIEENEKYSNIDKTNKKHEYQGKKYGKELKEKIDSTLKPTSDYLKDTVGKRINPALQSLKKFAEKTGIKAKDKNNIQSGGANSEGKNYVGLSSNSYYLIIASYIIALIIILEGLLRNFIFSIYVNMVQINSNNNPYNNTFCIQKIRDNPVILSTANYTGILSLSYIFLIPFILPFLISFLKFDNYDIKHNAWFRYIVLFFIFYPIIFIFLSKVVLYKKLEIFPALNKFLVQKDYPFTTFLQDNFSFKVSTILVFLFIILVYSYYKFVYANLKCISLKSKIITYVLIFLLIFVCLPIFLIFFCFSFLFLNKEKVDPNISTIDSIQNEINNNLSINSLYELLVKYNYPCFMK
jgi:hypothetical protein